MFHYFKKSKQKQVDMNAIQTDMHSHILPGIDDGAQNVEESIDLFQGLHNLGYQNLIATPHVMGDYYPNTHETIERALYILEHQKNGYSNLKDVHLDSAAEYFYDASLIAKARAKTLRTIGKGSRFLFEVSFQLRPLGIEEFIYQSRMNGYTPVLAHPERYLYLSIDQILDWQSRGVEMQLDLLSILKKRNSEVALRSKQLVKKKGVKFIGTDIHRYQHLAQLEEALCHPLVHELVDSGMLLNKTLEF